MAKPLFNQVSILGLGLIGSSLARVMMLKGIANHIAAYDQNKSSPQYAMKEGFIHSHYDDPATAVEEADLILFATPPTTFEYLAQKIASSIKPGALISDVASVKRHAITAIRPHVPKHAFYVPAHPVAGSEKTGPEAGTNNLFDGKRIIFTPDEADLFSEPVTKLRSFWEAIGAKLEYMPADVHDRVYAYVSHLPQLVSYGAWEPIKAYDMGDESFARFTRLSRSDPSLWADVCITNSDFISEALTGFMAFAGQMQGELSENTTETAEDTIAAAKLFPKIVATCLIATTSLLQEQTGIHPARYAGKGFADMVSPATHDPEAALAAISSHTLALSRMLESMLNRLHAIKDAVHLQSRTEFMKALGVKEELLSA